MVFTAKENYSPHTHSQGVLRSPQCNLDGSIPMHKLLMVLLIAGVTPINPLLAIYGYSHGATWAVPVCVLWGLGAFAWFAFVSTRKGSRLAEVRSSRD